MCMVVRNQPKCVTRNFLIRTVLRELMGAPFMSPLLPPGSKAPNSPSLCDWTEGHGCGWSEDHGCSKVMGGPGAAMQDHEIFAVTWSDVGGDASVHGGPIVDAADFPWSPLVWAPGHVSPNGERMFKTGGLRLVNRTEHYRCKE